MTTIHEYRTADGIFRLERLGPENPPPGSAGIHMVTLEIDGRAWCLAVGHALKFNKPDEQLGNWHRAVGRNARRLAAEEAGDRFLPETLAYVRSLPDDRRSDYLDPDFPCPEGCEEFRDDAIDDVRRALVSALSENDPYRAAVTFEKATPYLQADIGLISVMQGVLPAFEHSVTREHYMAAAQGMEKEAGKLRGNDAFAARQISLWHRRRSTAEDSQVDGGPRGR